MKDIKSKALNNKIIKMKRSDFIKEHKHLLKVLKSGVGEKKEYKEQKQELKNI